MEDGDRRDTVRNSVYNPDCSFYYMLQSHIYLSDESRHCRQELNLKTTRTFQTQLNRAIR